MNKELLNIILPFLFSLLITAIIIPAWIRLCTKWKLFDKPDSRKHHCAIIPTMGGIAIFAGFITSFILFNNFEHNNGMQFILASSFILFFTGFFDDLTDISARKKLCIQAITVSLVVGGGLRIESLNGLFNINEIALPIQFAFTVFVILFITNAYNFIDGIDGLAATIGMIVLSVFSYLFYTQGEISFATLCFCMMGALTAFIYFNFDPAKIFMGDTGSLVIGFIISVCTVKLFTITSTSEIISTSPSLIIGVLFILIFDLSRVVFIRLFTGTSPFKADRSHLHHMICRQEFGHRGATVILALFNLLFIGLALVLTKFTPVIFLTICFCTAILLLNSKVITLFAVARNKIAGEPKKKLRVNSTL